ncbi:anhydro-N-acetylmuramic acid kinase [Facilibium subflavum]|uniref:anhydro-N-acetylmuramic acid kinase n=1 Tax=Facilibium subflavum TaxID=2219058 RepID=UPI000E64D27E|nr:anhydro-N-acetylmuramic acid kinase [Facilibium subflavum]
MNKHYYIGVMSGTSMDGIDCVVAHFSNNTFTLIAQQAFPYPQKIKSQIHAIYQNNYSTSLDTLGAIDYQLGFYYAKCINELLTTSHISKQNIKAIGCHGQTIFHAPTAPSFYTLQLGKGAVIAEKTGIDTINDFRSKDIANGGQGAPLAPAFHQAFFASQIPSVILNLGGIANITCLHPDKPPIGFDTGPANTLLDQWILKHHGKYFDQNGKWGQSGQIIPTLLEKLLADAYFQKLPPKSTGREYFNLKWLEPFLSKKDAACDVQTTLYELTAKTVAQAVLSIQGDTKIIYVCGGGSQNIFLRQRLQKNLPGIKIVSIKEAFNIDPQWIEALCFAWFSYCFDNNIRLDLCAITGCKSTNILGTLHKA